MADPTQRYPDNAAGQFYVDRSCIDCDACRELAPEGFSRCSDGYSFVYQQPATREEAIIWRLAMTNCPVEAIGDDGQDD